ncbi:MAG TPA: hypothetical protein VGB13_02390 [Candidatus Krumholzibacteria bacterium]
MVATVIGSVPEIRDQRAEVAKLPGFDMRRFDNLEGLAFALGHAHAAYRAASSPEDNVAELAADLADVRDTLHADAGALAQRGFLDKLRVSKMKTGNGYKDVAFDVLGLVEVFRNHWANVQSRTAVQPEELDAAELAAKDLITVVGLREQAPTAVNDAARVRQQAYTLLLRAYNDARRAIQYVRFERGDADDISPSLYGGRKRSATESQVVVAPPAPVPSPVTSPAAGAPAPASGEPGTAAGLPGANPFTTS